MTPSPPECARRAPGAFFVDPALFAGFLFSFLFPRCVLYFSSN